MIAKTLKTLGFFLLLCLQLAAGDSILGAWTLERHFTQNGENHREREELQLSPGSFRMRLTVDITKGPVEIKGLAIDATGLWKLQDRTLVLILGEIRFAGVASTRGIDRGSFRTLVRQLRERYLSDPIRIFTLLSEDGRTLTLKSPEGVREYRRP